MIAPEILRCPACRGEGGCVMLKGKNRAATLNIETAIRRRHETFVLRYLDCSVDDYSRPSLRVPLLSERRH